MLFLNIELCEILTNTRNSGHGDESPPRKDQCLTSLTSRDEGIPAKYSNHYTLKDIQRENDIDLVILLLKIYPRS